MENIAPQAEQREIVRTNKPPVLLALERSRTQIAGRLPAGIDPDRFTLGIATVVQKNKDLLNCDPSSVLLAAYEAAELGINLSPALQLAYLIPYGKVAQLHLGYRGMVQKAYETGAICSFFAEVVYEHDAFERQFAPKRNLLHSPGMPERGEPIGAYALVEFQDGHLDFEYLTAAQIQAHKRKSRQQNSMMWTEFWEEAWRKTAIRVLAKRLPLVNPQMEKLVEVINTDADKEMDYKQPQAATQEATTSKLLRKLSQPVTEVQP